MSLGKYSNMPVLYLNALASMPSDFARDVWLWAIERPQSDGMGYFADRFAIEADQIAKTISPMIDASPGMTPIQRADLFEFILKRHANWRFGGNTPLGYSYNHPDNAPGNVRENPKGT